MKIRSLLGVNEEFEHEHDTKITFLGTFLLFVCELFLNFEG